MKVTQELVTVWAEPETDEVNFVVAGLRITLTAEETALLASGLARSLERLRGARARDADEADAGTRPAEPAVIVRRDDGAALPPAEAEAMQLRTRALIQASIRDKGLSLREETRS